MKTNWRKRIGSFLLAAFVLVIGATPVFAEPTEPIQLIFEDVTENDPTILSGEAKLKVSLANAADNIYGIQAALNFVGDLQYKSVKYLFGSNNPAEGSYQVSQNTADVNRDLVVTPTVLSKTAFDFSESTDLFIITFHGNPSEKIRVSLDESAEKSYITADKLVGGSYIPVTAEGSPMELTASVRSGESIDAAISVSMDKLADIGFKSNFSDDEPYYRDPGVSIRILGEENSTDVLIFLDDQHRDTNASVPTFKIRTPLLANSTYTVKITGMGFAPYEVKGVNFNTLLSIDNTMFVPGDVNGDEKVDGYDKALFKQIQAADEYNEAADFNRDGKVNNNDFTIVSHLPDVELDPDNPSQPPAEDEKTVPERMEKPNVIGGNKSITVEWEKLKEDKDEKYPVTGYIIKYGFSKANMDETEEVDDPDETSVTITNLEKDTTYYVCIAAVNENGTGTFSSVVSNKTDGSPTSNGGGGGSGGGGGGGSTTPRPSTTPKPENTTQPTTPSVNPDEPFTDLENYEWAKEAIYTLKDENIINGTSDTTYSPANNIKRGDFILILVRMLGIEGEVTDNFADVPEGSYYYEAIGIAKNAGIAKGSGDNFMPEETITRQDLITLAYRAFLEAGVIAETDDLSVLDQFGDKDEISEYALAPMASMVSAGVIKGSDGNVNPQGNATRAETAVMCARLFSMMN